MLIPQKKNPHIAFKSRSNGENGALTGIAGPEQAFFIFRGKSPVWGHRGARRGCFGAESGRLVSAALREPHLEVEDAGVLVLEALPVRHHAVQDGFVQRQRGDGRQQPAVTCGGFWGKKRLFLAVLQLSLGPRDALGALRGGCGRPCRG